MNELSFHLWIIVTAILCGLSCASVGTFLVLRKQGLLGDAISHSVLPGIAGAFFLTNTRDFLPMFIGASLCGLLTAVCSQFLQTTLKLERGAALGVVFTTLFAAGIIIIRQAADNVDLDPGCVLYGLIEFIPLDTNTVFGFEIPRAVVNLSIVTLLNFLFVAVLFKELNVCSFDEGFSHVAGFRPLLVQYLLVIVVAVTTVVSFEAVGSILVVSLLIVPGAIARFFADRLKTTLLISCVTSIVASFLGYIIAFRYNTSVSGSIATSLGLLFVLGLALAPKYGLISGVISYVKQMFSHAAEDALGLLFRAEEGSLPSTFRMSLKNISQATAAHSGIPGWITYSAIRSLLSKGNVYLNDLGIVELTEQGRNTAKSLVRSHRLWERYLVEQLGLKPDHVHRTATTMEHYTDKKLMKQLEGMVSSTEADPHGRDIPE